MISDCIKCKYLISYFNRSEDLKIGILKLIELESQSTDKHNKIALNDRIIKMSAEFIQLRAKYMFLRRSFHQYKTPVEILPEIKTLSLFSNYM